MVLDRDDRVLLLRSRDPFNPGKGQWWELPGGGMDPGESSAAAAEREIHEETGLVDIDMGPCVWQHDARFTFAGLRFDQLEHIHVARWTGAEAAAGSSPAEDGADPAYRPGGLEMLEAMAFSGFEWWTVADLEQMRARGERIIPPWLPDQLPRFLVDGPPEAPIHLGDLGPVF